MTTPQDNQFSAPATPTGAVTGDAQSTAPNAPQSGFPATAPNTIAPQAPGLPPQQANQQAAPSTAPAPGMPPQPQAPVAAQGQPNPATAPAGVNPSVDDPPEHRRVVHYNGPDGQPAHYENADGSKVDGDEDFDPNSDPHSHRGVSVGTREEGSPENTTPPIQSQPAGVTPTRQAAPTAPPEVQPI